MGNVTILSGTTRNPITHIGEVAGICWGADVSDPGKNYKRGLRCLAADHGRTLEFARTEFAITGYSARVIREWYTHIGGAPSRLQESTRYIDYTKDDGFKYVIPHKVSAIPEAKMLYEGVMRTINNACSQLEELGIPREDTAMLLPLGMETAIVDARNARNLIDMSHQRMCSRAYWEYRQMFNDIRMALSAIDEEWALIVKNYFMPKCDLYGRCPEHKSCGYYENASKAREAVRK